MRRRRFGIAVLGCLIASALLLRGVQAEGFKLGVESGLSPRNSSPRYVPLDLEGDPEALLKEQWKRIQKLEGERRLQVQQLQEKELEALKELASDPSKLDPEKLKKTLDSLKDSGVLKELEAAGVGKLLEGPKKMPSPEEMQKLKAALEGVLKRAEETRPSEEVPHPSQSGGGESGGESPRPPDLEERLLRWLRDRMHNVDESKLGGLFRDSRAWQDALAELDELLNMRERPSGRLEQMASGLLPDPMGLIERLDPSEWWLPSLTPPDMDWGLGAPPDLGGTAWLWGTIEGILWSLVGGGILVGICWFLWLRARPTADMEKLGWRPGPWPVDPAQLTDAAQLIRAFEHLALVRFGLAARARNHLALTQQLAAPADPEAKQQAAQQLCRLYEQARYAPDAPLSADALDTARRSLCLLAVK
jgi:hypothetical protein